jgi:multidrug transporter EmrE-like cation transporter
MKKNLLDTIAASRGIALPIILATYSVVAMFVGHVSFKQSTMVQGFWRFWAWQILGHLVAASGVLAYTWLIKLTSLHLAFAVYGGLGFVAVQVFGAWLLFKERITVGQWIGALLVFAGIVLIALTRPAPTGS